MSCCNCGWYVMLRAVAVCSSVAPGFMRPNSVTQWSLRSFRASQSGVISFFMEIGTKSSGVLPGFSLANPFCATPTTVMPRPLTIIVWLSIPGSAPNRDVQ
jgi:hypothetical protein